MRASLLLVILIILLSTVTNNTVVNAQQRKRQRLRPAPTRSQNQPDENEQTINNEAQILYEELGGSQRVYIESLLKSFRRAYRIYKLTNDLNRVAKDLNTDWNVGLMKKVMSTLPDNSLLKTSIHLSVRAILDALTWNQSYLSISNEVSNDELLRIAKDYKLENIPPLMGIQQSNLKICSGEMCSLGTSHRLNAARRFFRTRGSDS